MSLKERPYNFQKRGGGGGVNKKFYPEFGQADDKKIILYVNSPINVSIKFQKNTPIDRVKKLNEYIFFLREREILTEKKPPFKWLLPK